MYDPSQGRALEAVHFHSGPDPEVSFHTERVQATLPLLLAPDLRVGGKQLLLESAVHIT